MDGTLPKPGILLRVARAALDRMIEHGDVGEAARLGDHLKVAAAAVELPRFKTMQIEELLEMLEEGGFQVPWTVGIEIVKEASQVKPGSTVPDAANVLDMLWMWTTGDSEPRRGFSSHSPKLCELSMSMLQTASAFKSRYVDSYIGALLAMGPGCHIETAADLFLERWDTWNQDFDKVCHQCPGREAAMGTAPLA